MDARHLIDEIRDGKDGATLRMVRAAVARARACLVDGGSPSHGLHKEHRESLRSKTIPLDENATKLVSQALASMAVFKGAPASLLDEIAAVALSEDTGQITGPNLPASLLDDGCPLLVVLSGGLRVSIGLSTEAQFLPGSILNVVGMLGLNSVAERFKPTTLAARRSHAFTGEDLSSPRSPSSPKKRASRKTILLQEDPTKYAEESPNVQNLCPVLQSPTLLGNPGDNRRSKPSFKKTRVAGWMRVEIADMYPPVDPVDFSASWKQPLFKTTLAAVSSTVVDDILKDHSWKLHFEANKKQLSQSFVSILKHSVFHAIPPEVAFALAEVAEFHTFNAGDLIVGEGFVDTYNEALLVVDDGMAVIEKMVYGGGKAAEAGVVGYAEAGAVIGDPCFLTSSIPYAASLRATEPTKVLSISSKGLLDVLTRFPGIQTSFSGRLRETSALLESSLRGPLEILAGLSIFTNCSASFIRAVANIAERKQFYAGETISPEGDDTKVLRLIEFGLVRVEKSGIGLVNFAKVGSMLGEKMFYGLKQRQAVTFRAATPITILLCISRQAFNGILKNHPLDAQHFEHMPDETDEGASKSDRFIASLPIFSSVSSQFLQEITSFVLTHIFKPSQTILVQGNADSGSVFIVTAGKAAIAVNGRVVAQVGPGASFGEITCLGLVRRRSATVRAVSLCFTKEIQRAHFLRTLEKHPEEQEHFGKFASQAGLKVQNLVTWPMLSGAPTRLSHLVNLNSRRLGTIEGEWAAITGEVLSTEAAILVLHGTIRLISSSGESKDFAEGSCFGEQVLLGLPAFDGRIVPLCSSDIQILTRDDFERIFMECPGDRTWFEHQILTEMALKAEEAIGFPRGEGSLRLSALFRASSHELVAGLVPKLTARLYQPSDIITQGQQKGDSLILLLSGSAAIEPWNLRAGCPPVEVSAGAVFGESAVLGLSDGYPATVRALSNCLVRVLSRLSLGQVLQDHPTEKALFDKLNKEESDKKLAHRLHEKPLFATASKDFLTAMCQCADDTFFAPGETLMKIGDVCIFGKTCMYIILSGTATVHDVVDDEMARLSPGDIVGEGSSLGLVNKFVATVKASSDGLLHCARIRGSSILHTVQRFTHEYEKLKYVFAKRIANNQQFQASRKIWLEERVVPALKECRVCKDFPESLITTIAEPLLQKVHEPGEVICQLGKEADSMLLLISGTCEVLSKAGNVVGILTDGAIIGELALLNLLNVRTATIRVSRQACTVAVPGKWFWHRVEDSSSLTQASLNRLIEERRRQVNDQLPLKILALRCPTDDVGINAVSLHAEVFNVAPGVFWSPLLDDNPSGPSIAVLAAGRARLVLLPDVEDVTVLVAGPKAVIPEGYLAESEACVLASSPCKIYRMRHIDLMIAASCSQSDWFAGLEALIRDVKMGLRMRLVNSKSLSQLRKTGPAWALHVNGGRTQAEGRPPSCQTPILDDKCERLVKTPCRPRTRERSAPLHSLATAPGVTFSKVAKRFPLGDGSMVRSSSAVQIRCNSRSGQRRAQRAA